MFPQCLPCFLLSLLVLWSISTNHSSLGEELVPDPTSHSSVGQGRRVWQRPPPDPTNDSQSFLHGTFPPGFLWGTGTSAQQSEGSWDSEGKGASIWDRYQGSDVTHDVSSSSDSWEEDVEALGFLGVRTYSFSLSWPRLFPDGNATGPPNTAAVEHYSRLLDRLLVQGIEPVVTLYHWDLPQALQDAYGGWKDDSLVALFDAYATFCFRAYGSRVKYWLTMHNPALVAMQGYGTGIHAPGEVGGLSASLTVAHNLIRAHSKAWHTYNNHFRSPQKGAVSIALGSHWVQPPRGQSTPENVERCQASIEAVLGWFANPIFIDGDYPQSMRSRHGDLLPRFTPEEKQSVWGTADFFALSFGPNNLRMGQNLVRYGQTVSPDLRSILDWIKLEYGDQKVLVAEAGWFSESSVGTDDTVNMYLTKRFINQVLQAITLDGVRVFGYTAWSLVDGYEWNYGYSVRRGLFYVDFSQPIRNRLPKTSALYYRRVIKDNGFPGNDETRQHIKGSFPCSFQWGVADSTLQVRFHPSSPQFTDPHLYSWNLTGDGSLRQVSGVNLPTRGPQCTDYLSISAQLRLLEATGTTHYRFSLNWSLILPQGDLSVVNTDVLRYYRCVLAELHKLGLEAVVTLYYPTHRAPLLGLPAPLHASGGWLNQSTVEAFLDYAALCYRELGPWVRRWITINEPNRLVDVYPQGEEQHRAAHNLLLAHARAWRLYEREFSSEQGALVSLALHADWAEPANPFLESHTAAAQRFLLFELGRFLDPLLGTAYEERGDKGGDYPTELKTYLEERALAMGLPGSPLPHFTETEKEEISGTLGFIALNHFTTRLVYPYPSQPYLKRPPDHGCLLLTDPTWSTSGRGQALVPWGLRKVLGWVSERYGGALPVVVTASGVDDQALVEDRLRQYYTRSYLQEALKAVQLDSVNLQGFYVWRLQDEHLPRFGLFSSTHHQSKPKASVQALRELISHGGFPEGNATGRCHQSSEPQRQSSSSCTICAQILHNKPVLLLAACFLLCAVVIIVITIIIFITSRRRRNRARGRGRRRRMMKVTEERGEVLVYTLPPDVKPQTWDTRVTSPKMTSQKVTSQNLTPQKVTSQ